MLETLSSKEGRGTELISIYIPPDRKIHEVMANLREEYGTAANIKSRTTRKHVQEAIEKVSQRLKLFKDPPPNGLVIFCGAIPQNGAGSEKMEIYVLEPPEPIGVYFYRCDSRFNLDPLYEILKEKETFGVIVMDGNEAVLAIIRGRRMEVLKQMTSGIPGKHRAGGQSARRFERIREAEVNAYYKRIGSHANDVFLNMDDLRGIIIGGPGPSKYDFMEGDYLNYMLKEKIIATVDTTYVGERGVDEIVQKSQEILKGVRYMEEKRIVQRFLYEIGHETGLAAYGETEVRRRLREGLVETLLLSEKLNMLHVITRCKTCGHEEDMLILPHALPKLEQDLLQTPCRQCSNLTIGIAESKNLLDEFIEMAERSNVSVEVISMETEEGVMLKEAFGGIAAILRYKPA
jgi:peptide chain release factor subunit 1